MPPNPSLANNPNLDDWIVLGTDGRVTIRTGKIDLGQHISTALALIAADELDVAPERIHIPKPATGTAPDEGMTTGSNSMQTSGRAVRLAAATARHHLLALAAAALEADPATLEVADGLIRARETNRSITYWDLLGEAPFGIEVDLEARIKPSSEYKYVGREVAPRGMGDIADGKAEFVHDMHFPGMLHARLVRPPHYHARLMEIDAVAVNRLADQGIRLVVDGSFIAVAAEDEYATVKAAERIAGAAHWDMGPGLEPQDIFQRLRTNDRVSLPVVDGTPVKEPVPELGPPPDGAAITLAAGYERSYLMHGSIGPSAAAALWEDGKLTVWSHSQGIFFLRQSMAQALEMDPDDLTVNHAKGSGCYGHNGADDAALDAALIARANPGKPVLLKWTRDDEHAWEPYGSAMAMDLRASLDADGRVIAWSHETHSDTHIMRPRPGPGMAGPARLLAMRHLAEPLDTPVGAPAIGFHLGIHRNLDPGYDFPQRRLVKSLVRDLPLRTSTLRTLGAHGNIFAIECFMDELAQAAGIDPLDFRLAHLSDPRSQDVIRAAIKGLNVGDTPTGRGRGVAFARYENVKSYCAVGVELEVTDAAEVKLHRAVLAADAGQVVDPRGLASQLEGGFLQGASWTLYEAVAYDRDGITSRDWDTYPILRFAGVPEIETVLVDRPGEPFLGAGEATCGPAAAAIAIAIHGATGLRLRRMPFTPDAIRAAAIA